MLTRVDPRLVSVRDLSQADIPFVLDYWFRSPPGFIESLGADLTKLPSEAQFADSLRQRVLMNEGLSHSKLSSLAILHSGQFVGFHNLNPLTEGDFGVFHAHISRPDFRRRGVAECSYPQACRIFLQRFGLKRILFKTPVQNAGAIRVKEKLGIRCIGEEFVDFGVIRAGTLAKVYELTREDAELSLNQLPLETKSLLIRQVVLNDASILLLLSNEEEFRAWLPSQVYRDESHARSVLEFLIGQYSNPANPRQGAYVLVIEHKADRTLIGHVGFSPIDDDVEIGFAIAQQYQGHGFAVEAIVAASRWAFKIFQLERILGIASSANIASKRALVRAGYAHQEDKIMRFQGTEQAVSVYALSAHS